MKRGLPVLAVLCLAAVPRLVFAGNLNLSWTDCGAAGQQNRDFACNTNTTNNLFPGHIFVGSYVAPAGLDSVNGASEVVDVETTSSPLPDWWRMATTPCGRSTSLAENYNFTAGFPTCLDYWGQQTGGGGIGSRNYMVPGPLGVNSARLLLGCAIGTSLAGPIAEGTETYAVSVKISNQKSTGLGACAGCTDGVCIMLNSIKITQNARSTGGTIVMDQPAARSYVTFQGGLPSSTDCGIVPTRSRTWGQVKSLYR